MNQEFVIDGTDIICNLGKERLLAPLLQLILTLHENKYPFFCYFDADTRYKFEKDVDKQLYQSLIKFGLNDHFNQVTAGDADKLILKQAGNIKGAIISTQTYSEHFQDFPWLAEERESRLMRPDWIAGNLRVDKMYLKVPYDGDTIGLAVRLVNLLEGKRDNLTGMIDKYKTDRNFGFIRRLEGDKKLFFHRDKVTDSGLDYTVLDTPVDFKIDIDQTGGIYYFCAVDIVKKREVSKEEVLEKLSEEKDKLSASKEFLQKQTFELKEAFERQMQEIKRKNDALTLENQQLRDKVDNYTGTENQLVQKIEAERKQFQSEIDGLKNLVAERNETIAELRRELDILKNQKKAALEALERKEEESNQQAIRLDFQEEKIKNLDDDLKAALRLVQLQKLNESEAMMYDQLRADYNLLLNSLQQKNSKIAFLNSNLQDLQTQLERMVSPSSQSSEMERLIGKINELEQVNKTLVGQMEELEKRSFEASQPRPTEKKMTTPTTQPAPDDAKQQQEEEEEETRTISLSDEAKRPKKRKPQKLIVEATRDELEIWWDNLEDQWKIAFNQAVFSKGEVLHTPDEDQLRGLFTRKKFDIVGAGILLFGLNQLSFKLTNLSGLRELSQITELNLSGHDFTSLEGIEQLNVLEFLNCTSNRITTLVGIDQLVSLKTLIIQGNDLISLRGIENLQKLEYFNCLYNSPIKSIGKIKDLPKLQTLCIDNYKTIVRLELEELMGRNPGLEVRNV